MEDNRSHVMSVLHQLLKYLGTPARYPLVKRAAEYYINKQALHDSSKPTSSDIQMARHFATTSCEALIDFDNGKEEDNELQHMALTALDALDLSLKL
jgi:hypothetical protein